MLSPDNEVSDATFTQAHNRYSYTLSNPLKYTDPTGNSPLPGVSFGAANSILSPGSFDFSSFNPANADWAMLPELRQNLSDQIQEAQNRMHDAMNSQESSNGSGGGPSERYKWTGARNNWGGSSSTSLGSLASEISANYTASAATFTGTPNSRDNGQFTTSIYRTGMNRGYWGTQIQLKYTGNVNPKNTQWVQSIKTDNAPSSKVLPYNDPVPGSGFKTVYPFYNTEEEQKKEVGGFYDFAAKRVINGTYWKAELSLVIKGFLPVFNHPVSTIEWGFNFSDNKVHKIPLKFVSPSIGHLKYVNAGFHFFPYNYNPYR